MDNKFLYREKLFSLWISVILLVVLVLLVVQLFGVPIGTDPMQKWISLGLILLFLLLLINFAILDIRVTCGAVSISYGMFKYVMPVENIIECIKTPKGRFFGGWGIRLGKVKGKWILVYNTVGNPTVTISLQNMKYQEFIFSTKHPEKVAAIIKEQMTKRA